MAKAVNHVEQIMEYLEPFTTQEGEWRWVSVNDQSLPMIIRMVEYLTPGQQIGLTYETLANFHAPTYPDSTPIEMAADLVIPLQVIAIRTLKGFKAYWGTTRQSLNNIHAHGQKIEREQWAKVMFEPFAKLDYGV